MHVDFDQSRSMFSQATGLEGPVGTPKLGLAHVSIELDHEMQELVHGIAEDNGIPVELVIRHTIFHAFRTLRQSVMDREGCSPVIDAAEGRYL